MKNKILICGYAQHGKDTVAEYLRDRHGISFESSSYMAMDIFLYHSIRDIFGYSNKDECYNDRVNHRELWHDLIKAYNSKDKARLAKEILAKNDCYVGMRAKEELDECIKQGLFTHYIWVDASDRKPEESIDSCTIRREDFLQIKGAILLTNNTTLEALHDKLDVLAKKIK